MNVYVFKTSIEPGDIKPADEILRSLIPKSEWSFDMEDCDKILRVMSKENITDLVCLHLSMAGFYCEELE